MYLNQQQQQMLEQAISYADKGWHVLPISKMSQQPLIRGWHDKASTDRSQVISWFSDYPAMDIGVLTGEKSGFWVVELHAQDQVRGLDSLKRAFGKGFGWDVKKWLVGETESGKVQLFVQWNPEHPVETGTGILPGVDLRGRDGHVIVAPSVGNIHNKWVEYRWCDPLLPICPFDEYGWLQDLVAVEDKGSIPTEGPADDIKRTMNGLEAGDRAEVLKRYVAHLKEFGIDRDLALGFIEAACARAKPPFDTGRAVDLVSQAYDAPEQRITHKTVAMNTFTLDQGRLRKSS